MELLRSREQSLASRFDEFHAENPHVYIRLRALSYVLRRRGVARIGIDVIFGRLRWEAALRTDGDPFKLNNSYRAFYARLLMEEPGLERLFETRVQHSGG